MKVNTQIEFNITIGDISSIYSKNFDHMLLQQAKELYEKKCYDKQYILSIDSIVKRSLPNLIRRDFDAKVRVFIVVEAVVLRFDKYDTICNMTVNKIIPHGKIGPNDLLECSNEQCRALLKLNDTLTGFKIGDIIPIKVGAALVKIQNTQVLINAYPFVPYISDKIAYVIPKLSTSDKEQIVSTLIPMIENQMTLVHSIESGSDTQKRYKYFEQLLYPYKTDKTKKPIGKQVGLLQFLNDLDSYENEYVYVDQCINMSDMKVSILNTKQIGDNEITIMNSNMFASIIAFMYVKHLDTVYELSNTYVDDNVFEQHQYIWDLYKQNKF